MQPKIADNSNGNWGRVGTGLSHQAAMNRGLVANTGVTAADDHSNPLQSLWRGFVPDRYQS